MSAPNTSSSRRPAPPCASSGTADPSARRFSPAVRGGRVVVAGELATPGDGVSHGLAAPTVFAADQQAGADPVRRWPVAHRDPATEGWGHVDGDGPAGAAGEPFVHGEGDAHVGEDAVGAVGTAR